MYLTQAFIACVGIIGLTRYKRLIRPLKIIVWYIILSIVVDGIKDVMIYHSIRTLWIDHWFDIAELLLFILVFNYWQTSKWYSIFIWWSFIIYLLIWFIGKFSFEPFMFTDIYSGAVSQIIQIVFGGLLLFALLNDENIVWKQDSQFWIVSGIVFYAAATFFLFASFDALLTLPRETMRIIWNLNRIFIIIQYVFFLRGFLCKPQVKISAT